MKTEILGTGVALVTPFDKNREIDFNALGRIVDYTLQGEVDYVVALGTTAEAATMNDKEREEVLKYVIDRVRGSVPVVAGLGGNNTAAVAEAMRRFDTQGVDAFLSVTPYYNRPSQKGLYEHYKVLAESSPLPLILYNVPSRTGVNMSAETTLALAHDCENIIAIKEASGNLQQMAAILRDRPEGFKVFSGDDALALHAICMGAEGVISVAANAFPQVFSTMIRAAMNDDLDTASFLHLRLQEICEALFAEGNPVGIKLALEVKGLAERTVRLPLVEGSDALYERISKIITESKI